MIGAGAAAFVALVMANFGLIVVSRSRSASLATTPGRRNRTFWHMLAMTIALLAAALAISPVRKLFGFSWPDAGSLAVGLAVSVAVPVALEAMKPFGLRLWPRQIAEILS